MKRQITQRITSRFAIIVYSATIILLLIQVSNSFGQSTLTYPIVDTDQEIFYDTIIEITEPLPGQSFYGQDAHYTGNSRVTRTMAMEQLPIW